MLKQTTLVAAITALALIASAATMPMPGTYSRGDVVPTAKDFYGNGFRHAPAFLTPPKWFDSKTFSTVFGGNDPWDK